LRKLATFVIGEFAEDEIGVADAVAESVIGGANAIAREIIGAEVVDYGFKAVVAASAAAFAETKFAEFEREIVANGEEILRRELVEIHDGARDLPYFVVIALGFDEEAVTVFGDEGAEFRLVLPVKFVDFGIKIERQKADVVAREIVLVAWVAKSNNDFHICYYSMKKGSRMGPPFLIWCS